MVSGPPLPDRIRLVITLVSTDRPLVCDVLALRVDGGWSVQVSPDGFPPFSAFNSDDTSPILTWLAGLATLVG